MSENEIDPAVADESETFTVSTQLLDLQGWGGALGAVLVLLNELADPFPTEDAVVEIAALNPDVVEILSNAAESFAVFADKILSILPPQESEPDE